MNIDTQKCRYIASELASFQKQIYFGIEELDQRHRQILARLYRLQQYFYQMGAEAEQVEKTIHPGSQNYFKVHQEFTPLSDFIGKKTTYKIGASLSYHAFHDTSSNEYTNLKTNIGNFKASGSCELGIWQDYKVDPHVKVQAQAGVSLLESQATASIGVPKLNVQAKAKGTVGVAKASAHAVLNTQEQSLGFKIGATAAEGEVCCAFHISSITITLTGSKAIGTFGAEAEYSHKNREWQMGAKLGFIAGAGFKVKVKY